MACIFKVGISYFFTKLARLACLVVAPVRSRMPSTDEDADEDDDEEEEEEVLDAEEHAFLPSSMTGKRSPRLAPALSSFRHVSYTRTPHHET